MTDTAALTTTIEQTALIAASPETIWKFWTEPDAIAEWWGAAEVVAEPGGQLRVVMENGPTMSGSYTELDPPHRLVFTFGWEGNAAGELAPGESVVEVTLTPEGDRTLLALTHSAMPSTHAADHTKGWQHFIDDCLVPAVAAAT